MKKYNTIEESIRLKKEKKAIKLRSLFKQYNCIMIDDYSGCGQKIRFICSCGKEDSVVPRYFRKRHKCHSCVKIDKFNKLRLKEDFVKKYFENNGCVLLDNYKNSSTKMKYICVCKRESMISYSDFSKGHRCKKCGTERSIPKYSKQNNKRWRHDREEYNKECIFRKRCQSMLKNLLKKINKEKTHTTEESLGYNCRQLKCHIENHPNWTKVKDLDWHIDHIFPIKAFLDYNIWDIKLINCLENLQPLSAKENISKHDNYDKNLFINWIKSKNVLLYNGLLVN